MWTLPKRVILTAIELLARPYVFRELSGWGRLTFLFDYKRDWLWQGAPTKTIPDKVTKNLVRLDLSKWADRSHFFLGRWHDLELLLLLAELVKPGETVVDIGANRGGFTFAAAAAATRKGKVISFEPNPIVADVLRAEIALNAVDNVVVHQCGLSDCKGLLPLTVPNINSGEGSFAGSLYESNSTFTVDIHLGDDFLANETPAIIKIDVEGYETKVVRGLSQTIQHCFPMIITEIISQHLERAGSSVKELNELMESFGYKAFRLSLQKKKRRYDWGLVDFDQPKDPCDVIWLNEAQARHQGILARKRNGPHLTIRSSI